METKLAGRRERMVVQPQVSKLGLDRTLFLTLPPIDHNFQSVTARPRHRRRGGQRGKSPRLSLQASEIKLLENQHRGWGDDSFNKPAVEDETDFTSEGCSELDNLTAHSEDTLTPPGTVSTKNRRRRSKIVAKSRLHSGPGVWPRSRSLAVPRRSPMFPRLHGHHNGHGHSGEGDIEEVDFNPKLRRPTLLSGAPVSEESHLFRLLLKDKELKPYDFHGDEVRSNNFYATHYPILMGKLSENNPHPTAPTKVITEREVEEELKLTRMQRRAIELRERVDKADDILRQMELDPEDPGPITTELRANLFDPTAWPWNLSKYSYMEM